MRNYLYRLLKNLLVITMAFGAAGAFSAETVSIAFHDSSTVTDSVIFLKDIAVIAAAPGPLRRSLEQTAAGESAPPGYSRMINTNDLIQYRLRAKFPTVSFSAGRSKRITVRTACVEKKAGDYLEMIRDILASRLSWKEDEWTLSIENPGASWKCFDAPLQIDIEGLTTDRPKGHVQLQLEAQQFGRVFRIPLSCVFHISAPVAVARADIGKDALLMPGDIEMKKIDITGFGPDPFFTEKAVIGRKAQRSIKAGAILQERMMLTVPAITKGDQVSLELCKGRVKVTVAAIARENGYQGKKIWVENAANHKLIRAVAKDSHTVILL